MPRLSDALKTLLACIAMILIAGSAHAGPVSWRSAVGASKQMRPNILTAEDAAGANNGAIGASFEFHTDQDDSPWWQVDLGEVQPIGQVVIHALHMPERLNGFHLKLSDDGQQWRVVHEHGDTARKTTIKLPLENQKARFVRIQVPTRMWMHLAEVEVFAAQEPEKNLALHKPADQSSVSQWSTRSISLPDTEYDWRTDFGAARRVVEGIASHAGPGASELRGRCKTLADQETKLDDPAWAKLYAGALAQRETWKDVVAQWPLVNLDALVRALDDLSARFPERYTGAEDQRRAIAALRGKMPGIRSGVDAGDATAYDEARRVIALQRQILLANPLLDFDRTLIVRRGFALSARSAMGGSLGIGAANHTTNDSTGRTGWDNEIAVLSGLRDTPHIETVYKPGGGKIVSDLDLSFDAGKVMFSSVGDAQSNWRVFEIGSDGTGLAQITPDDGGDIGHFDACYLPDGDIIFASTATYQGLPCVYGSSQMVSLYRLSRSTGQVRQLTFEQDSDWCPTVLNDGRVVYLRWEYADLPHSSSRVLFWMNPDGTEQREYYGTGSYFMPSFFDARPIPGHASRVIGIATGHHGTARSGRLIMVDPVLGHHEADGVVQEFPGYGKAVEPIVRDRLVDGVWPQFTQPYPLSSEYHLVSMKPTPDSLWGVYLVDAFDNMTLVYQQEDAALLEPIPLQPRAVPPAIPDRVEHGRKDATVFLSDVYAGGGLAGVPRGAVKRLRVGAYYFSSRGTGGLLGSIGMDGPWDIKRVLGTVPVGEDGSAFFTIPANTPIFVQPLDDEGKALQLMRSWFVGMPGEVVSCVGCHETRQTVVKTRTALAARRVPVEIEPWHAPVHGFSFPDDVQPVLDRHCVACHDGRGHNIDLRGDEYITDWSSQISGNSGQDKGGNFSVSYANLHRYVRRPGIESDLHMLTPGEFHADTTELVQMLRDGRHFNVKLDRDSWDSIFTWIDLNAPFHGTWSDVAPVAKEQVAKVNARRIELSTRYAGIDIDYEAKPYRADRNIKPILPEARPLQKTATPTSEGWPFSGDEARRRQGTLEQPSLTVDLGDGLSMTFARIPAGEFITGGREPRAVSIDKPFWLGTVEVTNEQFNRFDPLHDSRHESRHGYQFGRVGYPMTAPKAPVLRVNWNEAAAFCRWLSEKTGKTFTLPTEDQWEYACRAGSDADFWFGALGEDYTTKANLGDIRLKEFAACTAQGNYSEAVVLSNPGRYDDWVPRDTRFDDGTFLTADVGSYAPNPWGLYDMHGNVWEWTMSERSDGRKIVRGGSWYDRPMNCTASSRLDYRPYHKVFNVGFRVMCTE